MIINIINYLSFLEHKQHSDINNLKSCTIFIATADGCVIDTLNQHSFPAAVSKHSPFFYKLVKEIL